MNRIQELENLANHRQALLDRIGELFSVPAPVDGDNIDQIIANHATEVNRIDELTKLVGELQLNDPAAQAKLDEIKKIVER